MQKNSQRVAAPVLASLQSLCFARVSASQLDLWWQQTRLLLRREPIMAFSQLLWSLVYHVLMPSGSLPTHVEKLTGQEITGSALSQRRQRLPWQLFETILAVALRPRAEPNQHPHAFYRGLRLVALDGTSFALSNTPKIGAGQGGQPPLPGRVCAGADGGVGGTGTAQPPGRRDWAPRRE